MLTRHRRSSNNFVTKPTMPPKKLNSSPPKKGANEKVDQCPPDADPKLLAAITYVVKKELHSVRTDMNTKFSDLDTKLTLALADFGKLNDTVKDLQASLVDCSAKEEKTRTDFLPLINAKINEISAALTLHMVDLDNHSRKWSLVINGIKGVASENAADTRKACLDLARNHLGIGDADQTPIAACHRLKQAPDAPVIIRFCDLDDRDNWMKNAKHLRNHPDKVSISPDLCPALRPIKKDLMNKRRQLPEDKRKTSSIKYTKAWPYVELYVNKQRHCQSDITKLDVVKSYTNVDPVLKFDINA